MITDRSQGIPPAFVRLLVRGDKLTLGGSIQQVLYVDSFCREITVLNRSTLRNVRKMQILQSLARLHQIALPMHIMTEDRVLRVYPCRPNLRRNQHEINVGYLRPAE